MCSPTRKGHDVLTSSPPSSGLSPAVSFEAKLALKGVNDIVTRPIERNPERKYITLDNVQGNITFENASEINNRPSETFRRPQYLVQMYQFFAKEVVKTEIACHVDTRDLLEVLSLIDFLE